MNLRSAAGEPRGIHRAEVLGAQVEPAAVEAVAVIASGLGASIQGAASSGLPGPAGNREVFLHLAEGGRASSFDLSSALRRIEPNA